jgi:hypothetical protein
MNETSWIKASASDSNGECVEMRQRDGMVEVRDSKDPHGPVLKFRADEFATWLDGARSGEFDHLTRH